MNSIMANMDVQLILRTSSAYVESIESYPGGFGGRGIVVCAGGLRYNTCAWVLINMLRRHGCRLPIQVWYLGEGERDESWIELSKNLGVECVDAESVRKEHPHPRLGGWELKPYAILHSPFAEVLFLDADNVPVVDPTYLFEEPQYKAAGALFWSEPGCMNRRHRSWAAFGVPYRRERQQESGQILIDKQQCWEPLSLCNWYNERSEVYYKIVYGDKDTFRFAWHRLQRDFAYAETGVKTSGVHFQYDLQGRLIFQHRFRPKWSLGDNPSIPGFVEEDACRQFLVELRNKWRPARFLMKRVAPENRQKMQEFVGAKFRLAAEGCDDVFIGLEQDGSIGEGRTGAAYFWWIEDHSLVISAACGRPVLRLQGGENGVWSGYLAKKPHICIRLTRATH